MLVAIVAIILAVPLTPSAHAYGGRNQQWQVTFSVNCNIASSCGGSGTFGFWGWCEFGGTDPTAMTGNSGDCQVTDYGRAGPGMPQNPPTTQLMSAAGISALFQTWPHTLSSSSTPRLSLALDPVQTHQHASASSHSHNQPASLAPLATTTLSP